MAEVRIMVSYEGEWVKSPESGTYRFDGSKAKGLLVPKTITYRELLDRIYLLLDVDRFEFGICMKFMYVSTVPVAPAEIVNDNDVKFFIGENCSKAKLRTPLCVTLERRTLHVEPVAYEEGNSQTSNSVPETQEQTCEPIVPLNGTEENEPGCCVNNESEDDDGGTSSKPLALEDVPIETQIGTGHPQRTDNATLVDPVTPVCPATPATPVAAVAPTTPCSSHPQDSRKPVEWVTTKEGLTASFYIHEKQTASSKIQQKQTASSNIPQKQIASSDSQQKQTVSSNKQKKQTARKKQQKDTVSLPSSSANHSNGIEIKQVFSSKEVLREKMSLLAIREKFEFKVYKSDRDRLLLSCVDDNCKWRLRASRCRNSTSFLIRKFVKDHTCSREICDSHHRQAGKLIIGSLIKLKCQGMNGKYTPKEIIEDVQREHGVKVSYAQARRARNLILNSDSGPDKQCLNEVSGERPKKRRKAPAIQDQPTQKKCGKCGTVGHYRITCQTYTQQHPSTSSGGAGEYT